MGSLLCLPPFLERHLIFSRFPGKGSGGGGAGAANRGGADDFPRSRDATKYPVYGDRGGGGGGYDKEFRGGGDHRGYHNPHHHHHRGPPPPHSRGYGGGGGGGWQSRDRGGRNLDPFAGRPVITYRDWDAPGDEYY